ncbi:sugar kinase, partial [Dickeya dadantii]|nr:sugar kinase [Dickeya dadantii]
GAVACGAYASLPQAAQALVQPGPLIRTDRRNQPFHDAKYQIYLQMYDYQQAAQQQMSRH